MICKRGEAEIPRRIRKIREECSQSRIKREDAAEDVLCKRSLMDISLMDIDRDAEDKSIIFFETSEI